MSMDYTKDGITRTFELDPDMIADEEEANPGYDLLKDLESMDGLKFSVMRRLAKFIGLDFKTMREYGLDMKDLAEIFKGCVEELGFTSDRPDSGSYSSTEA